LSLANQHCNYNSTLPPQAPGIFKLEINRSWGLTAARTWARLLIDRIHIPVLGFDDKRILEHRHAKASCTLAAVYATATTIDTASKAGAEGGEFK
jgi:hypothetical protein